MHSSSDAALTDLKPSEATAFSHLFMQTRLFFEVNDSFLHFKLLDSDRDAIIAHGSQLLDDDSGDDAASEQDQQIGVVLETAALHWPLQDFLAFHSSQILQRALGDRVTSLRYHLQRISSDPVGGGESQAMQETPLGSQSAHFPLGAKKEQQDEAGWIVSFGLVINAEKSNRRVERGPASKAVSGPDSGSAEKELEDFRFFWGAQKTQLRLFQDGSIIESVVWEVPSSTSSAPKDSLQKIEGKQSVIEVVSQYILGRHLPSAVGRKGEKVISVTSRLLEDACFQEEGDLASKTYHALTRHAVQALDKLRSILTSGQLKNLPISYDHLAAMCPELRYTSLMPVKPHPLILMNTADTSATTTSSSSSSSADGTVSAGLDAEQRKKSILKQYAGQTISLIAQPLRVLARFESSNRWPQDPEAILKCKLAMLLCTRKELKRQFHVSSD